jgi:hypothetical protein
LLRSGESSLELCFVDDSVRLAVDSRSWSTSSSTPTLEEEGSLGEGVKGAAEASSKLADLSDKTQLVRGVAAEVGEVGGAVVWEIR